MPKQDINIDDLNLAYGFTWAMKDFFVVDENCAFKFIQQPVRIDGYIVSICLHGKVSLEINAAVHQGKKNHLLLTKPMHMLRLVESSEDCRTLIIIFSKRFLVTNGIDQQIMDKLQIAQPYAMPVAQVSQSEAWSITHQFKAIWDRAQDTTYPFRTNVVANLLTVLLHDLDVIYRQYGHLQAIPNTRSIELTSQFAALVKKHFRERHDVAFYAKELHVTPKYLSATVKEATGKPASAIIAEALAIEAQLLIRQPNLSVREASTLLSFPDQSTFGKFFKRSFGITPLEYKKQSRN